MEHQDKIDILEIRNRRYKQTLQEIKKIAERYIDNEYIWMNYRDLRQIIRLIAKAEKE